MSEVTLHVYDLAGGMAAMFGYEGVWHTGVVIYGVEYAYGSGDGFGVHTAKPHQSVELPVKKTHKLGATTKTKEEFDLFVQQQERFHGTRYHLLENNCNHFSDVAVQFLLDGVTIPEYVRGLPARFKADPRFAMFQPIVEQFSGPAFAANANGMDARNTTQKPQPADPQQSQPSGHRHSSLAVPHSTVSGVTALTFGSGDPNKMLERCQQICTSVPEEEVALLRDAATKLGIPGGWMGSATSILDTRIAETPWEDCYPLVDLLRLAICREDSVLDYFCHLKSKSIRTLFDKFPLEKGDHRTCIVAMRLFANLFRKDAGIAYVKQSDTIQEQLWGIVSWSLESGNLRLKQAAASCAYNFAVKIAANDSDACVTCIAFLQHFLSEMETDSGDGAHDEIAFRLLSAVGCLLLNNDAAVELLNDLGDPSPRWAARTKKLTEISNEVASLLR